LPHPEHLHAASLLGQCEHLFDGSSRDSTVSLALKLVTSVPPDLLRDRPLTPDDAIDLYAGYVADDFSGVSHPCARARLRGERGRMPHDELVREIDRVLAKLKAKQTRREVTTP
jgi:hypothetical protein